MEEYEIAAGSSRISELSAAETLQDSDLLMFSNKTIGKNENNASVKITAGYLYQLINQELLKYINPGSMSRCETSDFANEYHEHDFSNIGVTVREFQHQMKIGTAIVVKDSGAVSSDVCVQSFDKLVQPEPYIGEVKMLLFPQKDKAEILQSISDGTFSGWVYPDGSQYSKTMGKYDFTAAWSKYFISDTAFRVPVLSNFMKLSGSQVKSLASVPYNVGIQQHSHEVDDLEVPGNFNVSADIYGIVANGCDDLKSNSMHRGGTSTTSTKNNTHIKMGGNIVTKLNSAFGSETTVAGAADESYPSHNVIPCMIYIGKTMIGG